MLDGGSNRGTLPKWAFTECDFRITEILVADVDDLKEGKGAEYVDASMVTLIFCSAGYFNSANCMREVIRAVVTGKPIVALLEPEAKHGGLTDEDIRQQLDQAGDKYAKWGLDKEVESWGYKLPTADDLYTSLFAKAPIEWNRIGALTRLMYWPTFSPQPWASNG